MVRTTGFFQVPRFCTINKSKKPRHIYEVHLLSKIKKQLRVGTSLPPVWFEPLNTFPGPQGPIGPGALPKFHFTETWLVQQLTRKYPELQRLGEMPRHLQPQNRLDVVGMLTDEYLHQVTVRDRSPAQALHVIEKVYAKIQIRKAFEKRVQREQTQDLGVPATDIRQSLIHAKQLLNDRKKTLEEKLTSKKQAQVLHDIKSDILSLSLTNEDGSTTGGNMAEEDERGGGERGGGDGFDSKKNLKKLKALEIKPPSEPPKKLVLEAPLPKPKEAPLPKISTPKAQPVEYDVNVDILYAGKQEISPDGWKPLPKLPDRIEKPDQLGEDIEEEEVLQDERALNSTQLTEELSQKYASTTKELLEEYPELADFLHISMRPKSRDIVNNAVVLSKYKIQEEDPQDDYPPPTPYHAYQPALKGTSDSQK